MGAKETVGYSMGVAEMFMNAYLGDLDDEEFRMIPLEGMNPIALQLGHLLCTEHSLMEKVKPGSSPPLPEGFEARHSLKEGDRADVSRYAAREEYVRLREAQRAATKALLAATPEEDLAKPGPSPEFAPTVGDTFNLIGLHDLSHVGQFVAVRRKLGKPIAF